MRFITNKEEIEMFPGTLNTGYDMDYTYGTASGTHYQLKDVAETSYRTTAMPTSADNILSTHSYSYDPNGNLAHESVARKLLDGDTTHNISERKLLWDGMNRLKAISENGYVSLYWYDADGNRTVKEHGGGEAVWVNSKHAGTMTDTVTCSIYPNPYININGNRWTKHYYIGGERIASMTGTISGGFEGLNATGNYAAGHDSGMTIRYELMRSVEGYSPHILHIVDVLYEGIPVGGDGVRIQVPFMRQVLGQVSAQVFRKVSRRCHRSCI